MALGAGAKQLHDTQGMGARGVYQSLFPILDVSLEAVGGGRPYQSEKCAALAEAYGGLFNKRVLDVGCGYGSTSVAIAAYGPREIVAVDRSEGMLEILKQVLLSNNDIAMWLAAQGAEELLGERYYRTVAYLRWRRATFQGGLYYRPDFLVPLRTDMLKAEELLEVGQVEAVIGNNMLHWPLNERREEILRSEPHLAQDEPGKDELLRRACHDVLWPLASLLQPGQFAVFMESKSFVTLDNNLELDAQMEQKTITAHPVYEAFHKALQRILKDRHDIDYQPPRRSTGLFRESQLPKLMQHGGFELAGFHHANVTYAVDPLTFCAANFPIVLGNIDLTFDQKMVIGRRVQQELATTLPDGMANIPIREQQFFIVLKRM